MSDKEKVAEPASGDIEIGFKPKQMLIVVVVGLAIWFSPVPEGVKVQAWHLLAIFVATIVGLILKPVPMGTMAVMAITTIALTQIMQ